MGNRISAAIVAIVLLAVGGLGLTFRGADDIKPVPDERRPPIAAQDQRDSEQDQTGDFDYYVLVLSWSPTHCASEEGRGDDDDEQCRSGRPYGFVLHGLWPQFERGFPSDCPSDQPRTVDESLVHEMSEISPSAALIQHEWRKHGTCSGLDQERYFSTARRAFKSIVVPKAYVGLPRQVQTTPDAVRDAFVVANPKLDESELSVTCRRNDVAEVWICLDKHLSPRACSHDVRKRHCGERSVRMRSVRGHWPRS